MAKEILEIAIIAYLARAWALPAARVPQALRAASRQLP
jgi:hypothetical protein